MIYSYIYNKKSMSFHANDDNPDDIACKTGKFTLFYDDFRSGFFPNHPQSPYMYFSAPAAGLTAANDAAGGVSANFQSLTINSTPFTFTAPSGLDHVKYLIYQKAPYNAPKRGIEIVYEGIMAMQQTGLNNIPPALRATNGSIMGINNVNSDIRVAAAGFNCLDPETLMVFDFFLSNEDIYAVYERLPFNRTEWGGTGPNYIAFTHRIPLAKRNTADPLNDFVKLAIAYNYRDNYVRWIINDQEMFRVNRLGYPIERKYRVIEHNTPGAQSAPAQLIRPRQLQFGFGTFSLMDAYNPQNPGQVDNIALFDLSLGGLLPAVDPIVTAVDGTTIPYRFILPYGASGGNTSISGTNFGQGAILRFKYVAVYLLAPSNDSRVFQDLYDCKEQLLLSRCHQNMIQGVNSSDSIALHNCKGKINNCDECDILCRPLPFNHLHDCRCYQAHNLPSQHIRCNNMTCTSCHTGNCRF